MTFAGALAAVTATAVDIFLPAQPTIGETAFGLPASAGGVLKMILVSAYLFGYGPGMLFWGPLADRFGRLPPLYVSLAAFVALAVVCALTESFEVLVAARCLQGVAGGGAPVIARAIARDMGGGARTLLLLTTMTAILSAAPLLSPIAGSALLVVFEWPSVFWALAVFGVVMALASFLFVPETRPETDADRPTFGRLLTDVGTLFRARDFVVGTVVTSTVFGGYAVLLSIGAVVAEVRYGVAPQAFGFLFAVAAVALVVGSVGARFMAPRLGVERVVTTGAVLAGLAGVALLLVGRGNPGLPMLWAAVAGYLLAFGMLFPTATAKALEPAGRMAGLGASLIGAMQMLCGAAGAAVSASLFDGSHQALTSAMGGAALLCLLWRMIDLSVGRRG